MTKLQLPLKYFTNIDTSVPQLNKYYEKTGSVVIFQLEHILLLKLNNSLLVTKEAQLGGIRIQNFLEKFKVFFQQYKCVIFLELSGVQQSSDCF